MAKDLNKVMAITGRLGKDPELRYRRAGRCSFSVASNRAWRDQAGATHEEAEWFRVVVSGDKLGEVCNQYLAKRAAASMSRAGYRPARGATRDGQTRSTTEVVASDMIMLGDARPRASDAADDEEAIEPPPARPAAAPRPRRPARRGGAAGGAERGQAGQLRG